jgi:chemotaxis protein methyltransferase CheR
MIMYLVPPAVQAVIARLTRILAARGYLFLGHAETLRGLSQQFELHHTHETFYYQKREGMAAPLTPDRRLSGSADHPLLAGATWMDEVQRASDRISTLSRELQDRAQTVLPEPREPDKGRTAPVSVELGLVFELLRQERFQEALTAIRQAPAQAAQEPDTLILRAVLLINCGDLAAAERSCRDILAVDDLNAGAHYLMALCCEHFGDINAAMEHDRKAIHLDANFAMPHLHLGRLARRASDAWTARRELEDASLLLVREETSRILLFGGGFSREALLSLSRAESRACGGAV